MRSGYVLIALVLIALAFGVGRLSAAVGTLDSPDVPGNTLSYTLEDIYNRLDSGAAGAQSTFTEPAAGPGTGTMHDLNQIMAQAPAIDNTNGATETNVLDGKTFWGLTGAQWGTQTGTMPDNGAVTIVPTTTNQAIAVGYHNGSGEVLGDTDLVSGNIKCGVTIFGVTGSIPQYVAKTGQTGCWNSSGGSMSCTGTGQDGEYRNGGLPVVAPSGGPSFGGYNRTSFTCSGGFTDKGNGTVTDNLTGLIWLQDASCSALAGTTAEGAGDWTTALSATNSLASGTCGLSDGSSAGDWRLPNINELRSLFDRGLSAPYVPQPPFTGVRSSVYWSSTTSASFTAWAWYVNLATGNAYDANKISYRYLWPVRGGQ